MERENEKMKKRYVFLLGLLVVIVTLVIMFTREKQQAITLDETIIDISRLPEYDNSPFRWLSTGKKYQLIEYGETSIVKEGWSSDGSTTSQPRIFQYSLLYKNQIQASLAFYYFSPNMVYKDKWPNFYDKSWNLTKEASVKLNADRYIYYCGIGSKEDCQIWNYWAQYENYIVLFGLYSISDGNSIEELEQYISEIDTHFSDIIDK